MSDDELPELSTLLLRPSRGNQATNVTATALRRSPRKQTITAVPAPQNAFDTIPQLSATSRQRMSPRKTSTKRTLRKEVQTRKAVLEDVPVLVIAAQNASLNHHSRAIEIFEDDSNIELVDMNQPISKLIHGGPRVSDSEKGHAVSISRKQRQPTSNMSRITQVAREETETGNNRRTVGRRAPLKSNPYVLKEAHCDDFDESSGAEDEDDETDLSGFVVDDDAELTLHDSDNEVSSDSEEERRRRRKEKRKQSEPEPRRRLIRGRKNQIVDSEDDDDLGLSKALDGMNLGEPALESQRNANKKKTLEVIDLTSSPAQPTAPAHEPLEFDGEEQEEPKEPPRGLLNPFSTALKLQPSSKEKVQLLPSKLCPLQPSPKRAVEARMDTKRPTTPPATPPRSPSKTKLSSPTKLFSPSKTFADVPRSPHRQSMDAFWDHNTVNEWTDTYSPKKAPILSPRKNPLARFNIYATDDIDELSDFDSSQRSNSSQDPFDDSTGSLPSPSESPSKSRSPSKASALRAEQLRLQEEKKAKAAKKNQFDSDKEAMAVNLLLALDKHITGSKISSMSTSTGGIKVIWSKTLRSTAGRANWKRTVSKPSGSPVKGDPDSQSIERQPGVVVKHFASIELAEKIIDRPERLVNTLAHEFCHLANFMVSGIRDQPHGESFKHWGKQVTVWLRSCAATRAVGWRDEWKLAEVTTKHDYIVETKYLWVCTGRPAEKQKQTFGMKLLNVQKEDEEGCGLEYGRHSKSIDVEKQRCGRCKGFLVQVRPAPRTTISPRKSPVKRALRTVREESSDSGSGVENLQRLLQVVELSD